MADPFYYNKLAGPPEADSSWAQQFAPPVAQSPQEQAILDMIARSNLAQAGHLGRAGAFGGLGATIAGMGMMPGMGSALSRLLHVGGLGGAAVLGTADAMNDQRNEATRKQGLEADLESYATRDRR